MTPAQTMLKHLVQFQKLNLSLRSVCVLYHLASHPDQTTLAEIADAMSVRHDNGNLRTTLLQMLDLNLIVRSTGKNRQRLPKHHYHLSTPGYKLLRLPNP